MTLRVGLDFDNTLIDYDAAFAAEAVRQGGLRAGEASGKAEVKRRLLAGPGGERAWMRVQGQVYGARIGEGRLIAGVARFLETARDRGAAVHVVSHKTRYGHFDEARTDLRTAALGWMRGQGFFDRFGLDEAAVYFADTRDEKVARIAALDLEVFVDDLPEVLGHPAFPASIRRIHFAPDGAATPDGALACRDWDRIHDVVFGA